MVVPTDYGLAVNYPTLLRSVGRLRSLRVGLVRELNLEPVRVGGESAVWRHHSRLQGELKKLELPSVEEFQQRVEERSETLDLSMEEVNEVVLEARGSGE